MAVAGGPGCLHFVATVRLPERRPAHAGSGSRPRDRDSYHYPLALRPGDQGQRSVATTRGSSVKRSG